MSSKRLALFVSLLALVSLACSLVSRVIQPATPTAENVPASTQSPPESTPNTAPSAPTEPAAVLPTVAPLPAEAVDRFLPRLP